MGFSRKSVESKTCLNSLTACGLYTSLDSKIFSFNFLAMGFLTYNCYLYNSYQILKIATIGLKSTYLFAISAVLWVSFILGHPVLI